MTDAPKSVATYMAEIGRKGGQSGKGAAKRRSTAYYKRISKLAVAAKRAKKMKRKK
jgi:hypothetical protein